MSIASSSLLDLASQAPSAIAKLFPTRDTRSKWAVQIPGVACPDIISRTKGAQTMRRRQLFMVGIALLAVSALLTLPVAGQLQQERVDMSAMEKIRDEGLQRSQVMQTASYLTDVFGPRLTNSPNIKAAA